MIQNNDDWLNIDPVLIKNMEYPLPTGFDKFKYNMGQKIDNGIDKLQNGFDTGVNAVKRGLSNLNDGKNTLFQGIKGLPDKIDDGVDRLRNGVSDILLGKQVEVEPKEDENGNIITGITNARQGGIPSFANDFKTGFNDNLNNSFKPSNMYPVQNKGFAQRLGEALGTATRMLDNPLARGALAYGLSRYNGDNNPLEQGLTATVGTIKNKTADRLYRNSIIDDEKNKLIESLLKNENFQNLTQEEQQDIINAKTQEILNKYNNINGYIGDDLYKNMLSAQQLKDNAEWRKANLLTQQQQMKALEEWRKSQLDLDWAKLQNEKEKEKNKVEDSEIVMKQLEQLMHLHEKLPQYKAPKGTKKGVAAFWGLASDFGLRPDEVASYEGVQNMMTNLVARKLAGEKGVMTDKDFDRAKKMVPSLYDTPQQAKAKYEAIKLLYYANPNNAKKEVTAEIYQPQKDDKYYF